MFRVPVVLALVVLAASFSGCSELTRRINEQFPPVSSADRQSEATDLAAKSLAAIQRADAYAAISDADLGGQLSKVLAASDPRIRSVSLRAGKQEIVADVDFDGDFPEARAALAGTATVHAAMAVDGTSLVVKPSASAVRIRQARIADKGSIDAALPLINAALRRFLDNINGRIAAQKYPLDFSVVQSLKPADFFRNVPGVTGVSGSTIDFALALGPSAVLIDGDGVHVIAQLGAPATPPAATNAPDGSGNLDERHAALARAFRGRVDADLGPLPSGIWSRSAAAVGKQAIAGTINRSLGNATLCVSYAAPPVRQGFNQIIRTEPAPDLGCERNARSCSQAGDCNPNWNCRDCQPWDVPCHIERGGCEADKVRYRTQCEAEKEGRRLDCERLKATEIAGCKINQTWLNQFGSMEIGRVEGDVGVNNAVARACFRGLTMTGDLSRVDVATTVAADVPVQANVKFTPYNLANIACLGQWSGSVSAAARVAEEPLNLNATVTPSRTADGRLQLDLAGAASSSIRGRIEPPPLSALLSQNPSLTVVCAPAVGAAKIAGVIDPKNDPFAQNAFEVPLPAQKMPLVVQPVRIATEGISLMLEPAVEAKALVFTAR